jgi:hypothetical protein
LLAAGFVAGTLCSSCVLVPAVVVLLPRAAMPVAVNAPHPEQPGDRPADSALAPAAPEGAAAPAGANAPAGAAAPGRPAAEAGAPAPGKAVPPAPAPVVDMIRFKPRVQFGWNATYDKDRHRWYLDSGTRGNLIVDLLPGDAPTDLAGYADKLTQPDFQDPGTQYVDFSEKADLPDGFVIKGLVKDLTGKKPAPERGLVAVRTINGARIRCRSTHLGDDGIRNEAVEVFKGTTIQTWPLLSLGPPSGWVLAPHNVTLIVSLGEQAKLVYYDTLAGKEVKRVDLDFQPGNLAVQGKTLFAAARGSSTVYALDLAGGKAGKEFSLGSDAVTNLACHPAGGLVYAATTSFHVYSLDPLSGSVARTPAKGFFLAVDPLDGKFVYTGVQPPDRDEIEFREGPDGSFRIFRDMWGPRAMIIKYAVEGPQLRYVDGQNNAAVNGWSMALTPDGKRIMIDGGGGWRPTEEGGTGGGYVTAVYSTDNLKTMVGQGPQGLNLAFHPVLNLGAVNLMGSGVALFNAKSLVKRKDIPLTERQEARASVFAFAGRGTRLVLWNGDDLMHEQGLHFIPLDLSPEDRAALEKAGR